jgi:peptidoglycan hydrolase-like protein with peptidoglycan-binding domain
MPLSPRFARSSRLQQVASGNASLQQGEQSDDVRVVQLALIDLGYRLPLSRDPRGLPDGAYGPDTARAVVRFQADNGIAADGVVGRATLNRLSDRIIALMVARQSQVHLSVQTYIQNRGRCRG